MSFEVFPHVFLVFFRSSYVFLVVFRQTYIICLESTWLSPPMYQYRGDNNTTISDKESATCQSLCVVLYGFLDLNPLWWVFSPFADDVNHLPGDPPLNWKNCSSSLYWFISKASSIHFSMKTISSVLSANFFYGICSHQS